MRDQVVLASEQLAALTGAQSCPQLIGKREGRYQKAIFGRRMNSEHRIAHQVIKSQVRPV